MTNWQPKLSNDHFLIRPLSINDYESLYTAASDPLIWEQHYANRHEKHEFDRFFQESLNSKGALVIIDNSTKEIIGSSRYERVENSPNAIEIGWSFLKRNYWGGRANRQVKILMIEHAFLFVDYVLLYIDVNNKRSQGAARKMNSTLYSDVQNHPFPSKGSNKLIFYFDTSWNADSVQKR